MKWYNSFLNRKTLFMKDTMLWFVLVVLVLTGCRQPVEPEFKTIANLKFSRLQQGQIALEGEAILYNPNKNGVTLLSTDLMVDIEGTQAKVIQQKKVKIKGQQEFSVPLRVELSLDDINNILIPMALDLLAGSKIKMHFKGNIEMKVMGAKFNVPIDHRHKLSLDSKLFN
ncbi:MAG: hypothetical protein O6848_03765 [Bacteroidetes bacterium]|nr:hypothetical protein [Bacteroidota bacterium]